MSDTKRGRSRAGPVSQRSDRGDKQDNRNLASREEEYKKLNAELEAKTANLVKEAEDVLVLSSRPQSGAQSVNQSRPQSRTKKSSSTKSRVKSGKTKVEDVATVDDAFITEYKSSHVSITVKPCVYVTEAQIRFLKAKLRVMQEEMDRLAQDINKKEEETSGYSVRVKELEEERGRLTRTGAAQTAQIDKYKTIADDSRAKADSLETQLIATKKELDGMKRTQKQAATTQGATEVRLNRALEEIERLKEQLSRAKTSSRESSDSEKRRVDQLVADNKRLEKQKNELMAGFKKQLKLIDILKRQKMHIEAAKMLSFSEEEFVKALEWGS
ncbi:TEX9-like protein [Mya arenaria]|uniref:TEX9-like protein n=1 Tax=Mya arenaria TaxID=6604 RepID=A0ABY7G582_MYAAR|nr:TEX9-like protein [Mya arenaria]